MPNNVFILKEFRIPVYGGKVVFIVFKNTWRRVISELKARGFNTRSYKGWHHIYGLQIDEHIKDQRCFVVILKKKRGIEDALVHELYHLTQAILEYKEVPYSKGGANEPYAYLIGELYKLMINHVREKR